MICVRVPILLKNNIGVLFIVLGPRIDACHFFSLLWYAIILWVLYIYI
jgi:hypothetical protein